MSAAPYQEKFFESIRAGSRRSADKVLPLLTAHLDVASVLDLGCGPGAWLAAWRDAGVADFVGVDGAYLDPATLAIDAAAFRPHDLATPLDLGRRFDLVQSLEVAEHLPACAAGVFVDNLVRHGDRVLFSAAVPGQGGKHHVNERPLDFWRNLFRKRGFAAFDPLRPALRGDRDVEPWYRYNTLLYVRDEAVAALPAALRETALAPGAPVPYECDLGWRLRLALVRPLPVAVVTFLAGLKE